MESNMPRTAIGRLGNRIYNLILSVPVHIKIAGLVLVPVLVLGLSLNYWVALGLQDWLSYLLTDVRVEAAMRAGRRSVQFVTVLAAAGSLLIAYLLTYILTRPLLELRRMAQHVAEGDLTARVPIWSNDEIGDLAGAVNTMTDHLVDTQAELALSNRHLTAINRIILAANRPAEIHDVLFAVLSIVVDVMNLKTGWIYLRDPDRNAFHLATWYGVPEALQSKLLHAPEAPLCNCQSRFLTGALTPGFNCCTCLRLDGVVDAAEHITVPLAALDQQFGVMNLLVEPQQPISREDEDLLRAIGAQVAEIVANAWLRIKLDEKEIARQLLLEYLVKAQEEERSRLARELHDGAGQMLTSLLVRIKALEKKNDPAEIRAGLSSTLDVAAQTLEQVRDLSYRLRPASLEEFGLALTIETLVHDMTEEAGLIGACTTQVDECTLSPELQVTLYRIAQEALTNVVRHAHATHVRVALAASTSDVTLCIEDNGRGFSPYQLAQSSRQHMGLISMQERAEIVGGALTVTSGPDRGTRIEVLAPLVATNT
jgi:signal transduction histidine kinase